MGCGGVKKRRVGEWLGGHGGGYLVGVGGGPTGKALGVGFLGQLEHGRPVLGAGVFQPHDLREVGHVLALRALGQFDRVVVGHQVADAGGWFLGVFHGLAFNV